jgi:hypothetical protein
MTTPDDYIGTGSAERDTAAALLNAGTSWNELRANGVELQEASSSTYPPNDRYIFIRDGEVLNRDQIDSLVTHAPPLYEIDVQPGETWIIRGKDRNAYLPGFDTTAAIASEVDDTGPDGQYVPDGIELATGYALLREGSEEGFPLIFEPDDVRHTVYKGGTEEVSSSLEEGDWDFDPFASDDYQYDLAKFAVKRQEFDLYGAGDCTQFLKIRDQEARSHYVECSTVGIIEDPLLAQYNLPNSVRVTADGSRSSAYTVRVGPLHFYNRASVEIPTRTKETTLRDVTVNSAIDSGSFQVIGVYRIKEGYEEVAVTVNALEVQAGSGDCRVEVREVLPEFLSGLPADSEWIAPGNQNPDETAIEGVEQGDPANVGEYDTGTVSISTYSPEGKTIPRGRQIDVANADGGQGNSPGGKETEQMQEKVSELKYIALIAQAGASINRVTPDFRQRF